MKLKLFSFFSCILLAANVNAKVWRVNNNPGIKVDFNNLQKAIDTTIVNVGDTLYVEGSGAEYTSSLLISKRLTIVGPGYYLTDNDSTLFHKNTANLGAVTIALAASGTVLGSCHMSGVYILANNVVLQRNNIEGNVNIGNDDNLVKYFNVVINQNYIKGNLTNDNTNAGGGHYGDAISNLVVSNNIILGTISLIIYAANGNNSSNAYISNNIVGGKIDVVNSVIYNNITRGIIS